MPPPTEYSRLEQEIVRLRDAMRDLTGSLHHTALTQIELQGDLGVVQSQLSDMKGDIVGFDTRYASRSRFEIVERVVFGATALMLVGMFSAWITGALKGLG